VPRLFPGPHIHPSNLYGGYRIAWQCDNHYKDFEKGEKGMGKEVKTFAKVLAFFPIVLVFS
jgi:hypothetical protein